MASVRFEKVEKKLGDNPVLKGIELSIADGEFAVLVGPSGCGKSTLLRTLAGLETPDRGNIHIGERDVTHLAPRDRDLAMVFQSYALYPHMRVRDNVAFGLRMRGESSATIDTRVKEVSAMLGLEHLLDRFPRELSGGQRQRVAMGRAIARRAAAFLFDEPLSNLDAALRSEVRVEIKKLHASLRSTMIYVTHDQVEAMTLADKLVVLRGGVVEQVGAPLEIYDRPATRFVASFLGNPAMNFLEADIQDGVARANDFVVAVDGKWNGAVLLGIRPHDVVLADGSNGASSMRMRIEVLEPLGFDVYAHGRIGSTPFVARFDATTAASLSTDSVVELAVEGRKVRAFDPRTERAL